MANNQGNDNSENIRAAYSAIVDYHNNLVQIRFTVVGLFLAANGFLASGFFQTTPDKLVIAKVILPIIGLLLTLFCMGIEVRNRQLLDNLAARGKDLEMNLSLKNYQGFFSLMENQPIGPRIFGKRLQNRAYDFSKHVLTQTIGIKLIYICIFFFWLIIPFLFK
jgi:hypothetical protein